MQAKRPARVVSADALITTVKKSIAYDETLKNRFLRQSTSMAYQLADALGLEEGTYDVRVDRGGIAVSGEVHLHSDDFYVDFSQCVFGDGASFMWRVCRNRKDYTGFQNQWAPWTVLRDLESFAEKMKAVAARTKTLNLQAR